MERTVERAGVTSRVKAQLAVLTEQQHRIARERQILQDALLRLRLGAPDVIVEAELRCAGIEVTA